MNLDSPGKICLILGKRAAELSKQSAKAGEVAAAARKKSDAKALLGLLEKFEAYKSDLERMPLSGHTRRAYETRLQHFLGFLGTRLDEYPDALTNRHTRDYVARDYKRYLKLTLKSSPQTVNAYLTAIDSFFIFVGLGKVKADREDLPQLAPQALTPEEQKDFLRALERCRRPRDRAIATLLLCTGIRISECADLNDDDVLFTQRKGLVKIRNGKGGAYRELPLTAPCRAALQAWIDERGAKYPQRQDDAFFLSNRGTRLSVDSIDHLVRRIAQSAKLESVSAHTLRHTCLTNLVRDGADVVLVAQVGGHKKLETTMRYSLPTRADLETAMNGVIKDH